MQQSKTKFISLFPRLIEEASHSVIKSQLAAGILKGSKMISRPCANTPRNSCRGHTCGSLHAEAHAILDYFGRDLTYNPKHGWCFLPRYKKGKKPKEQEVGSYRYSY